MQSINITKPDVLSYAAKESLRAIRTNIQFCGVGKRVIMLTSAFPNEGKSTMTINLARMFAEDGKKVLVIDTDMRKSVFLSRLGVTMADGNEMICGLAHYLSGQKELVDVICQTNIEGLHIIFSGPVVPNPTEILGTEQFEQIIQACRRVYDYVLVDSAPIQMAIDAAVVAKQCDGVLFVIAQDQASRRSLQEAIGQIELTGTPILGAILNKYSSKNTSTYGNYYGSYYGDYYGTSEDGKKKKK